MPILLHVSTIIADSEDKILFVREEKAIHRGLWNLPGGHVEFGEHPSAAAVREVREETQLSVTLKALTGIYSGIDPGLQSVRFVFEALSIEGIPKAGDEIMQIAWMTAEEILLKSEAELVGPRFLRRIIRDWRSGQLYPLAVLNEM